MQMKKIKVKIGFIEVREGGVLKVEIKEIKKVIVKVIMKEIMKIIKIGFVEVREGGSVRRPPHQ